MELTKAVIFFVGFLMAICLGLPAPSTKDEIESVRPLKTYGDQPIVDTGYFSGWDNPFSSNPFGGLFDSLESVMERMRQQIASLLNKFPISKGNSSSAEFPGFNGVDLPAFPNIGDIDLSKGNTTSITKVVNGHTVVINETEYKNEDDFGGTFFKVRIIDVKPDSSELTTEKEAEIVPENATADTRDREEIENSFENEIPKDKETERFINIGNHGNISLYDNIEKTDNGEFDNIETFDEVTSMGKNNNLSSTGIFRNQEHIPTDFLETQFLTNRNSEWFEENNPNIADSEWSDVSPIMSVDSNTIESEENLKEHIHQQPFDLNKDTFVNEILARNGAPVNPDAEVFFVAQNPEKIVQTEQLIDPR